MKKDCVVCGVEFEGHGGKISCSTKCKRIRKAQVDRNRFTPKKCVVIKKNCVVCGSEFKVSGTGSARINSCSSECRAIRRTYMFDRRRDVSAKKKCVVCGTKFAPKTTGITCSQECDRLRKADWQKEYQQRNKLRLKENSAAYYKRTITERTAWQKEYSARNAEQIRARSKEWYWSNRERAIKYARDWAKANPERTYERGKKYREDNAVELKKRRDYHVLARTDKYMKQLIRVNGWEGEIPPNLIEFKRLELGIRRYYESLNN